MALSKQKATVFIVVGIILVVVAIKIISSRGLGDVDPTTARSNGNPTAKVEIIEFIDFECPACAHGAAILKEYMAKYPQDIHVQVKYYPLMNLHSHALQVASYAECVARQGKFWPFFDALMPAQSQWSQLVNVEGVFDQMATAAGANMQKLRTCLKSDDVSTSIMGEKALGRSLGVQSTPTYFINKKMVVGSKSLQEELNKYFK